MNSSQLKRGLEFVKIVKLSALNYIFLESLFFLCLNQLLNGNWTLFFLFICFMSICVYASNDGKCTQAF